MLSGVIMISSLKNNRCIGIKIDTSQQGSVLPVVLFFAASGLITVMSFLYFHLSFARPSLRSISSVQALLNARSGIYKGFEELTQSKTDSTIILPVINTLDSNFGKSMFNVKDTIDTGTEATKLTMDGGPVKYTLYADDSANKCEVSIVPDGGACILRSVSTFHNSTSKVDATLGSRIPALPDTVVICHNTGEWDAAKIKGTKVSSYAAADSVSPWLKTMISKYQESLALADTILDPPLTVQTNNDLKKIPSVLHGNLIIDGSYHPLVWKDTGTITILGQLDISNDVTIEGLKFVTSGVITLSGKVKFTQASIFTKSKLFIADYARFQGNAMACNSVAIYGNAVVDRKSIIVVPGSASSSTADSVNNPDKGKKIYAIEIGDRAIVDGILVALGSMGDIKTHPDVKITGIMIAQKAVGHLGKMAGLISAGSFVDPDVEAPPVKGSNQKNVIRGEIEPLNTIENYKLPFFLGTLSIVKWKEY